MILRFHPQARAEFDRSTDYYADIQPDLGQDFILKVDQALERIVEAPWRWPLWPSLPVNAPEIHRILVKRFPFGIAFELHDELVVVLAVAHLHAEPFYWMPRSVANTE